MKFQIGEQVRVISNKLVEIISEHENIGGVDVYYTLGGNSYSVEQIDRYYPKYYSDIVERFSRMFNFTVKIKDPEALSKEAMKNRILKRMEDEKRK
jgi:hypothetical protein